MLLKLGVVFYFVNSTVPQIFYNVKRVKMKGRKFIVFIPLDEVKIVQIQRMEKMIKSYVKYRLKLYIHFNNMLVDRAAVRVSCPTPPFPDSMIQSSALYYMSNFRK